MTSFEVLPTEIKLQIFTPLLQGVALHHYYMRPIMRMVCKEWCEIIDGEKKKWNNLRVTEFMMEDIFWYHLSIFKIFSEQFGYNKKFLRKCFHGERVEVLFHHGIEEYLKFCVNICRDIDITLIIKFTKPIEWSPAIILLFANNIPSRQICIYTCRDDYEKTQWMFDNNIFHERILSNCFVPVLQRGGSKEWFKHFFAKFTVH